MTLTPLVPRSAGGWIVAVALALGVALLVADHWLHALGALPYLLILACPLMHVLMHRGQHGHHRGDRTGSG